MCVCVFVGARERARTGEEKRRNFLQRRIDCKLKLEKLEVLVDSNGLWVIENSEKEYSTTYEAF